MRSSAFMERLPRRPSYPTSTRPDGMTAAWEASEVFLSKEAHMESSNSTGLVAVTAVALFAVLIVFLAYSGVFDPNQGSGFAIGISRLAPHGLNGLQCAPPSTVRWICPRKIAYPTLASANTSSGPTGATWR